MEVFMKIKIADLGDISGLYELNKLFGGNASKEEMENNFKSNNNEIICIGYINSRAVGFCTGLINKFICYNTPRLDIETLFIMEEYRNKGLGKSLLNYIENEAVSRKIFHINVFTDEENEIAKTLYIKLGFKHIGPLLQKTIENI
jgi:ribosomal protein S18 acetylase RimI-like enzyme